MHRSLAAWLTGHPWQAGWIAACLGILSLQGVVLLVALAGAVPVLLLLDRGSVIATRVMLVASVAVIAALLWFEQSAWFALAYAGVLFGLPLLLGELLRRSGSMNLVFQFSVLLALLTIALVYGLMAQPGAIWEQFMGRAMETLSQSGIEFDASLAPQLARTLWGAFMAVLLLAMLGALFLARWWQSLLHQPGGFGVEFRELRTGLVLGVLLVVIVLLALFTELAWLDCMAWVAMMGLALQGLASAHRRKAQGQLQRGWLVAIYVLLIVPLFSFITVALLAGVGFADFWRRMRMTALRA